MTDAAPSVTTFSFVEDALLYDKSAVNSGHEFLELTLWFAVVSDHIVLGGSPKDGPRKSVYGQD